MELELLIDMDKAGLDSKEKISYGLGAVGKDMVYMLSASYILYYYQDIIDYHYYNDMCSCTWKNDECRINTVC
ncbi:MAG: hypothetical protein II193_00960 [Lachnospiraceae bacterium]|nr:hypothetical protein [Lachnospiraceae bacterium]